MKFIEWEKKKKNTNNTYELSFVEKYRILMPPLWFAECPGICTSRGKFGAYNSG
jgi:hypothetical protein